MTAPGASDAGQSADVDRTARTIKGDEPVRAPTLERRQGVVTAVDVPNATIDVTLGGDTIVIPGVSHLSNYRPQVDDTVWVDVNGNDLLAIDRIGAFGPSVIATAESAFVDTSQSRSSTSYGDLTTVGPSVDVSISPSGVLMVQVSCWMGLPLNGSAPCGGAMGVALSGANSYSADDREAVVFYWDIASGAAISAARTDCASKVTLITGLNPGTTTVTAKYRSTSGTSVAFSLRHLWAVPL